MCVVLSDFILIKVVYLPISFWPVTLQQCQKWIQVGGTIKSGWRLPTIFQVCGEVGQEIDSVRGLSHSLREWGGTGV
jgi:hypothetical protein